jgi:RNA polymerase sigma-B factor
MALPSNVRDSAHPDQPVFVLHPSVLGRASDEALAKAAQTGDTAAREVLIRRYEPIVWSMAREFQGSGFPYTDLRQAGTIGVIVAIDRYNEERGASFRTYAHTLVRGELRHMLRDHGWAVHLPRSMKDLGRVARDERQRMSAALGRAPTLDELAASLDEQPARVKEALTARDAYHAAPYDEGLMERIAECSADALLDPEYGLVEHRLDLAWAMARLPLRQRQVIVMVYDDELSQRRIADELGISQMQVSRVLRDALGRLRALLECETTAS